MSGLGLGELTSATPSNGLLIRIWLVESKDLLNEKVSNDSSRYFHGFDISGAQCPPSPLQGFEFSVQDVLKPFPAEHHNRYDLVNARMLVAAITEPEYETVVKNLMTILSECKIHYLGYSRRQY